MAAQIERYQDQRATWRTGLGGRDGVGIPAGWAPAGRVSWCLPTPDAGSARYAARSGTGAEPCGGAAGPGGFGRSIGAGAAIRAARRRWVIELQMGGSGGTAQVAEPLSILALADGTGCTFFGSALGELLRMLTGFEGAMIHDRCRARGDSACRWQRHSCRGIRLMLLPGVDLARIRATLNELGVDGWLLFDFHGLNPILSRLLGEIGFSSRRLFVLIPKEGEPVALVHKIEMGPFGPGKFPGKVVSYARWEELHAGLGCDGERQAARHGDLSGGRRALPR